MGCCAGAPSARAALLKEAGNQDFRELYVMGKRLGEGTFGTVFECRRKAGPDTTWYAVKMMEHEASWWGRASASAADRWRMFTHEYKMFREMDHPNLVKALAVFIDADFVYFVMEKFECSLILVVLPLVKTGGGLPVATLGHIVRQMLESVAYMHSRMIVHRDVKADNFLVDSALLDRPNFRVVLTDFSTARKLEEGVYLSDVVGSEQYWAPEFAYRSYAHKVDVWAVGTTMWSMITMQFPFRSMEERFRLKLTQRKEMSDQQFDLLQGMLRVKPADRLSADAAKNHAWVLEQSQAYRGSIPASKTDAPSLQIRTPAASEAEVGDGAPFTRARQSVHMEDHLQTRFLGKMQRAEEEFNQGGRRSTLIDNLDETAESADFEASLPSLESKPQQSVVTLTGKQRAGETKMYEWWSPERCLEKRVPNTEVICKPLAARSTDPAAVANMCAGDVIVGKLASIEYLEHLYRDCNMDMSKLGVGQAKQLSDLYHELEKHECCLLLRDSCLIRVVDLVVLRLRSGNGKYLVEAEQALADGRVREVQRLPAVMCRAKGKGLDSARLEIARLLDSELRVSQEVVSVDVLNNPEDVGIEMTDSQSYPGLKSIYRRYIFNGSVAIDAAPRLLAKIGQPQGDRFQTSLPDGTVIGWEWWEGERCKEAGIPLEPQLRSLEYQEGFECLPSGKWTAASLTELLRKHKIDTQVFGIGEARSIEQLTAEANSGETRFFEKPDCPGKMRRYLEILIVKIVSPVGAYFIETVHMFGRGLKRQRNLLPATKVRPFEDKVWAVRRLLSELGIPFADSKTCFGPRWAEQSSSSSYPGIVTVYLKQLAEVMLGDIDLSNLVDGLPEGHGWYKNAQGS